MMIKSELWRIEQRTTDGKWLLMELTDSRSAAVAAYNNYVYHNPDLAWRLISEKQIVNVEHKHLPASEVHDDGNSD